MVSHKYNRLPLDLDVILLSPLSFSLGPLVSKVKEYQVEAIVDNLCANMVSDLAFLCVLQYFWTCDLIIAGWGSRTTSRHLFDRSENRDSRASADLSDAGGVGLQDHGGQAHQRHCSTDGRLRTARGSGHSGRPPLEVRGTFGAFPPQPAGGTFSPAKVPENGRAKEVRKRRASHFSGTSQRTLLFFPGPSSRCRIWC